jgi:hypothetical protein
MYPAENREVLRNYSATAEPGLFSPFIEITAHRTPTPFIGIGMSI